MKTKSKFSLFVCFLLCVSACAICLEKDEASLDVAGIVKNEKQNNVDKILEMEQEPNNMSEIKTETDTDDTGYSTDQIEDAINDAAANEESENNMVADSTQKSVLGILRSWKKKLMAAIKKYSSVAFEMAKLLTNSELRRLLAKHFPLFKQTSRVNLLKVRAEAAIATMKEAYEAYDKPNTLLEGLRTIRESAKLRLILSKSTVVARSYKYLKYCQYFLKQISKGKKISQLASTISKASKLGQYLSKTRAFSVLGKAGRFLSSKKVSGALLILGGVLEGALAILESPNVTVGGRVVNGLLVGATTIMVNKNPVIAIADLLAPEDYKLSNFYKGGAGAITAFGEALFTKNTKAMETIRQRCLSGDYTPVMRWSMEAGDYWAEYGITGTMDSFFSDLGGIFSSSSIPYDYYFASLSQVLKKIGPPDSDGVYTDSGSGRKDIYFRKIRPHYWQWSPDKINWMKCNTYRVKGGLYNRKLPHNLSRRVIKALWTFRRRTDRGVAYVGKYASTKKMLSSLYSSFWRRGLYYYKRMSWSTPSKRTVIGFYPLYGRTSVKAIRVVGEKCWFKKTNGKWVWSVDEKNWMPVTTLIVKGGKFNKLEVSENIAAIIDKLHRNG